MVGTAHSWVRSSGSALLHSCPLRVSLYFPFKWPLDTDRTGQETIWKPASSLDGTLSCGYLILWWRVTIISTTEERMRAVFTRISLYLQSVLCAHLCAPAVLPGYECLDNGIVDIDGIWFMWFLCDLVLLFAFGKKILCVLSAVCAFKNKRRKHHHDSTKNCVCARVCTCVCTCVHLCL